MNGEIKIKFAEEKANGAILKVIGVGGAGGNAINRMIEDGLEGVEFIAINTDVQDLDSIKKPGKTVQIGAKLTKGLGTGSNAEIGNQSALESSNEINNIVENANMVFITAGMGGGTGTGASPVIANHASTAGILTVAIVTKPFNFEGETRMKVAEDGIKKLMESVDSMIVIPNQKLIEIEEDEDIEIEEAYRKVDKVLLNAVQGISSIINTHGLNNTDFADVKAVMSQKGMTLMGTGEATGNNRAEEAVNKALSSPLLGDMSISGATGVLYNITGSNVKLKEITKISEIINKNVSSDVKIKKYGYVKDEKMKDVLRVTIIATGFDNQANTNNIDDPFEGIEPFDLTPKTNNTVSRTRDDAENKNRNYFFGNKKANTGIDNVRADRPAVRVDAYVERNSGYINDNSIPYMGHSDSVGDEDDIFATPTFMRGKIKNK